MNGKVTNTLKLIGVAFLLFVLLFANSSWADFFGSISSFRQEIIAVLSDSGTQWIVFLCLGIHFATLVWFRIRFHTRSSVEGGRYEAQSSKGEALIIWLALGMILSAIAYVLYYSASVQALTLLFSVVIAQGIAFLRNRKKIGLFIVSVLIVLLAVASCCRMDTIRYFEYRGHTRWSGPWDNPNLFGLLMGTAVVLSVATGIGESKTDAGRARKIISKIICALVAMLCGYGLCKSYSRGAWLGTTTAMAYLLWSKLQHSRFDLTGTSFLRCAKKWRPLAVIGFALIALSFWQFRFTDYLPVHRAFSIADLNDFSWRNRVMASRQAVRMMSNRPWIGFGWGRAESVYVKKYRPPQIENGAAIQMNDYFMLAISAGVPALVCFLVYVGLSLRSPHSTVHRPQSIRAADSGSEATDFKDLDWLQATCRAGAIVLLVGFFFDGGLFKLATGSVFWILLELGRVDRGKARHSVRAVVADNEESSAHRSDAPVHRNRWEIWLRRSAWILGIAAVSESGILLSTPFFGVNNTTLSISRHYLVPPSAAADLNLLATNVDWSSRKLRPLLQHASLANYNRQIINWKLDEQIYRDYVLNPLIDPQRDGQLGWRRKLWEYFYLPIRKENDPESAAEIVLKFLHQRISLVENGPITIAEMWTQKIADKKGFEALAVAAFRAVGIPARLNNDGQAELFADGKWQIPPEGH
jgi:O-antigen ligase/polysaccharide polymerase Wzy-like membrane protein